MGLASQTVCPLCFRTAARLRGSLAYGVNLSSSALSWSSADPNRGQEREAGTLQGASQAPLSSCGSGLRIWVERISSTSKFLTPPSPPSSLGTAPSPCIWRVSVSGGCTRTRGEGHVHLGVRSDLRGVLALCAEGLVTKAEEGCFDCSPTCKCQAEILLQSLNATFRRVYCFPP